MNIPRLYIDTSVLSGCFDTFAVESNALIQMARAGRFILLLSDVLAEELVLAPQRVRALAAELPAAQIERVPDSPEAVRLRDAYLKAAVVTAAHRNDAHHIALATIARADILVSWNFTHIVHWNKIRLFNAVNLREGYLPIDIRSPREVVP